MLLTLVFRGRACSSRSNSLWRLGTGRGAGLVIPLPVSLTGRTWAGLWEAFALYPPRDAQFVGLRGWPHFCWGVGLEAPSIQPEPSHKL